MQESGNFVITDAALQAAAEEVAMAMLLDVPAEPHTFSARFEKKMKRLLRRARHPVGYRVLRYAAAILLVITMLFGAVFAVSPEVRAAVINWVRSTFNEFFKYSSNETVLPDEEYEYYLPERFGDYSLLTTIDNENGKTYIYTNMQGKMLQFVYVNNGLSDSIFLKSENYDTYTSAVGTYPADIYIDRTSMEANVIVWQDPARDVLFTISAFASHEELLEFAGKVEKRKIE